MSKKKLKVKIFDKEYSLLVADEQIASALADYVSKTMQEIEKELKGHPPVTIAVITALNIAYDYLLEISKNKEFLIQATDKVKKVKMNFDESQRLDPY